MNIMITGGTGTLGQELVKALTQDFLNVKRIVIYSRNECAQVNMKQLFPEGGKEGVRYFIGDVRDKSRLLSAMQGIDVVIHAAALKSVDICEYDSYESVKTNVLGTKNVAAACIESGVEKSLFISTDKAPYPTTLYGATKMIGERIYINSNNLGSTRFACVRYGNVIASNSSVIPKWMKLASRKKALPITSTEMTRFFWSLKNAASFVLNILSHIEGGEIFIPKIKSYKVLDIARSISQRIKEIGIRGYEKMHETMITPEEMRHTYEEKDYYIIYPFQHDWTTNFNPKGTPVPLDFRYKSNINPEKESFKWLN